MWTVYVYGMYLDNIDSIGGWQLYLKTSNYEYATEVYSYLVAGHGDENVAIYKEV